MKAFRKITALLLMISLVFSGVAFAATPDEIAESTYAGMEWLASVQNADGSWGDYYPDNLARTGLALLKFETHALNDPEFDGPFDPAYPFSANVEEGLEFLLMNATRIPIGLQPAGDPDFNGNGFGVGYVHGTHHNIYITAIALMAISASGDPTRPVAVGPLAGLGYDYGMLAQDLVDYLSWAQTDPVSVYRGGWNYHYMNNATFRSDNSISGYAVMGLGFAEHPVYGFNCTVPQFVKDELSLWIDYIQNDTSGGSGYSSPFSWVNLLKTGNLLQQMAFVGDAPTEPRVLAAIDYIQTNWNILNNDPGWQGNPKNYQATFTLMKGLHAFDIETLDVGGDPNFDWFNDISDKLLPEQLADDSWPATLWDREPSNRILSTTWALLTLQKVAPPPPVRRIDINIKPGSDPNAVKPKPVGVLPVAILGGEDFDVMTVDCTTVRLTVNGTAIEPLRWAYEDVMSDPPVYSPDGYTDIIFHFDMEDVLTLVGPDPEGEIELILIGETLDEYEFMGTDVIWIVPKTQ